MPGVIIAIENRTNVVQMTLRFNELSHNARTRNSNPGTIEDYKKEAIVDDIKFSISLLFTDPTKKIYGKTAMKTTKPVMVSITDKLATSNSISDINRIDAKFIDENHQIKDYSIIDNDLVKNGQPLKVQDESVNNITTSMN